MPDEPGNNAPMSANPRDLHATLLPNLKRLERDRATLAFRIVATYVTSGVLLPLFGYGLTRGYPLPVTLAFTVALPLLAAPLLGFLVHARLFQAFARTFKARIIKRLVRLLDPNLTYTPKANVPRQVFNQSGLFEAVPNQYQGDDLVKGMIDQTMLRFSEVSARQAGKGAFSRSHAIFQGLFFEIDLKDGPRSPITVLPENGDDLMRALAGRPLQDWVAGPRALVHVSDPEFERHFRVHAADPEEAQRYLSPDLMTRMAQFARKAGRPVRMALHPGKAYVAIRQDAPFFEPDLFKPLLDRKVLEDYVADLELAIGIVADLGFGQGVEAVPILDQP